MRWPWQRKKEMLTLKPDNDTIAAIATASGIASIGVIRISGSQAKQIAQAILGQTISPRVAYYLPFLDSDQTVIDRGIAIFFAGPHSYTGEDVLELQAHGGSIVLQLLLQACLKQGARQAEPGEFTKRAFLNGKMDLAQAEAVVDILNASTVQAAKSAMRSLSGEFSKLIHILLNELTELRVYVEACIDFPEEDIDFISAGRIQERIHNIQTELAKIFKQSQQGVLLKDGLVVVLIGQPNVGKSSLINQLSGDEVAIVTPVAGTTRDTISTDIQIQGVPFTLVDTAGLRETNDEIEKIGIAKTWKTIERANIALFLVDANHDIGEKEKSILDRLPQEVKKIWVHNKIDLTERLAEIQYQSDPHVYISAKHGEGVDLLKKVLLESVGMQDLGENAFTARTRHLKTISLVADYLNLSLANLAQAELLAENLRLAQQELSSITGEFTADDLLGEIFGSFCIGK
ncbi:MAG: tRNA uridine-5-carboxymethylaminomethyl(34) synthesis GTPase MnmE [Methylophilaceae bacterium]|jgi:tRNA modification GTPase|nr:tRNA uridine-5-carboxymethylaminomethyl(34) synthesis GTPase MnmE [Methylophilaceae bacterium]